MFCIECGQKLNDGAKFCSGCGKPVQRGDNNAADNSGEPAGEKDKKGFSSFFNFGKKETGEKPLETEKTTSIILPDMIEESIEADYATISSDSKCIAMTIHEERGSVAEWRIMNAKTGKTREDITRDEGAHEQLTAVSSDGNYLTISHYKTGKRMVNTRSDEEIELYQEFGGINAHECFSEDNKRLAYTEGGTSDDKLIIIGLPKGNELLSISLENCCGGIAYSPDGRYIASIERNVISIFDARNGNKSVEIKSDEVADNPLAFISPFFSSMGVTFNFVAFSPDEKQIVTYLQNKVIKIFDAKSGNLLLQFGEAQDKSCTCIRFSPNGKAIVAGYEDGTIKIIDAKSGKLLKQLQGDNCGIEWATYTPNGKKLVTYADRKVKFWIGE